MIAVTVHMVIRIMLVILILAGMVVVLAGIGQLYSMPGRRQDAETARLRHDVAKRDSVVSRHSLLYRFLVRGDGS